VRNVILALVTVLVAIRACGSCSCRDERAQPTRIATFNIENFPKDARQIELAFDEIAALGAPIVAVQEITDTVIFERAMHAKLGADWQFTFLDTGSVLDHHIGVAFDRRAFRLVTTRVHDSTSLGGRFKPVFDVELADNRDRRIRVLVLHFKAGGENQPIRTRQHGALRRIVADVKKAGAPVVVLGDFNATGEADREDLARAELRWLTRDLECTAFWARDDGCPRSRLDHVLSTQDAHEVRAAGGCARHGCGWQDSCPLYAAEVSDHCPVVVDILR
jgi:endonuclease/exonuclease/phosphatase family metal-dependent hydrolase